MEASNEIIKFYILVPVYKTEKFIIPCLESIINQTYKNYEAVLVDDGTPDAAGKICDQFAADYEALHVIHKRNEGQIAARQAAMKYVIKNCSLKNAFYIFLDSDDFLQRNALDMIARVIEQYQCDMVVYQMQRICSGNVFAQGRDIIKNRIIVNKRELYRQVFFNASYNSLCRKAISCEVMELSEYKAFYAIRNGEDLLQSIPVYQNCRKVVLIPDILYNYTINPNSITHSVCYANYSVDSTVRRKVWDFLVEEDVFDEQDWKEYIAFCGQFLKNKIREIGAFHAKMSQKTSLLRSIKADSYYNMILDLNKKDLILWCLRNEWYICVVLYGEIYSILAKIYQKIRENK